MSKPHNPPAFTVPNDANVNGQEGMTLRDYFASQALQSIIIITTSGRHLPLGEGPMEVRMALDAYKMADAMLTVRERSA